MHIYKYLHTYYIAYGFINNRFKWGAGTTHYKALENALQ